MKRMGLYTGNIYDDSVDPETIKECCVNLNQNDLKDEELIVRMRKSCDDCIGGCPESVKDILFLFNE